MADTPEVLRQVGWWNKPLNANVHDQVKALFSHLKQRDSGRQTMLRRHMRLYGNMPVADSGAYQYRTVWDDDRIRLNVIKAACDTVHAKIIKNRPKPKPLTSGGNWSMRRKAKFLERFFDAQFYISKVHKSAPLAFLDAAVLGTGCLHTYGEAKEICVERVWPGELLVDELDGLHGDPRMVMRWQFVDRDVVMSMFPKQKAKIKEAARPVGYDGEWGYDSAVDQVLVMAVWRRPSRAGAGDGRYAICVDNCTLDYDKWSKDYLPFTWIRWTNRLRGFWGAGLAEELTGIQVEINKLLMKIQQSMHLMSVPRWMVEEGSRIAKNTINNRIGEIIYYRGQKPEIHTGASVPPEIFMMVERLYNKAFEIAGIGQLSGPGESTAGMSGIALRTSHDIESERFVAVGKEWEEAHLDLARKVTDCARDIGGSFALQTGKYTIDQVKWEEIDLDKDAYILQVFPTSSLPSTPAGRLATVVDMINAQLITPDRAKQLLDYPDLDADMSMDRAASDNIDRALEMILDEGKSIVPEPFDDINLALKKGQDMYLKALGADDVPEERLEALRRWCLIAGRLQKAATAEQMALQAPVAAGAPPPPGPNGAPPTAAGPSDGLGM